MSDMLAKLAEPKYRIPALTLTGFGIAGLYFYFRNKPNKTIGMDLVLPGVVMAVGLNLIGWLATEQGWIPVYGQDEDLSGAEAKSNGNDGMGRLSKKAVNFLSHIKEKDLYSPYKKGGLKVAPVPDDPSVVTQDAI